MDELRDLYQEVILDHLHQPRNHRDMPEADAQAQGDNPLCGDRLKVYVRRDGERLSDVSFEGLGCAICIASASMMTVQVKGKNVTEVERLARAFHQMVTKEEAGGGDENAGQPLGATGVSPVTPSPPGPLPGGEGSQDQAPPVNGLGKLKILAGVRQFPMRVKCATLAWHTLRAALRGQSQPVSTE